MPDDAARAGGPASHWAQYAALLLAAGGEAEAGRAQRPFPLAHSASAGRRATAGVSRARTAHGEAPQRWEDRARRRAIEPVEPGMVFPHEQWLTWCYRLTPRVERTSARSARLDLGRCTEVEACRLLERLRTQIRAAGGHLRVGVGPSVVLAELAAYTRAPLDGPPACVTLGTAPLWLRTVPVSVLPRLAPPHGISPLVVARLRRYGLWTLGHLARLDERTLWRQFGAVGTLLAAVAHGQDWIPFQPTPPVARIGLRVRLVEPLAPGQALATLPTLARQAATHLRQMDRRVRGVAVRVRWEEAGRKPVEARRSSGGPVGEGWHERRVTLRAHTDDPGVLVVAFRTLLGNLLGDLLGTAGAASPLPSPFQGRPPRHAEEALAGATRLVDPAALVEGMMVADRMVADMGVVLMDFAVPSPLQAAFWRHHEQQLAAVAAVSDTLAQRYGRPLLRRRQHRLPDAIFEEERYQWQPVRNVAGAPPSAAPDVRG